MQIKFWNFTYFMRLFIAVDVPESMQNYLAALQGFLPNAHQSFAHSFHLTLKFIGEVSESQMQYVREKLADINFSQFSLRLDKVGFFPNEANPHVVWIGVAPHEPFKQLKQQVDAVLAGLFPPESTFTPHVTLARIKSSDKYAARTRLVIKPLSFEVNEFVLYESKPNHRGKEYNPLEKFLLFSMEIG